MLVVLKRQKQTSLLNAHSFDLFKIEFGGHIGFLAVWVENGVLIDRQNLD